MKITTANATAPRCSSRGSFSLCPFRPLQPPVPTSLEPRLRHAESRTGHWGWCVTLTRRRDMRRCAIFDAVLAEPLPLPVECSLQPIAGIDRFDHASPLPEAEPQLPRHMRLARHRPAPVREHDAAIRGGARARRAVMRDDPQVGAVAPLRNVGGDHLLTAGTADPFVPAAPHGSTTSTIFATRSISTTPWPRSSTEYFTRVPNTITVSPTRG